MKLQIDLTGKGGLAPRFYGDVFNANYNLRYIGKDDQMASGIYNPFKKYGYLSASNSTKTTLQVATGNANANIGSALLDLKEDDIYVAERGDITDGLSNHEIYRGNGLSDTDLASVLDLGATVAIHDLEMYMIGGVQKVFYTYNKNGTAEVGYADTGGALANPVNTWLTTTATGSFSNTLINDIFMRVADNGYAYLFMDNQVHKIDGTEDTGSPGTVTANVVVFPNYFQITDAVDNQGKIFMNIRQDTSPSTLGISISSAPVGVYVWDRFSTSVNMQNYIPIPGVKEIKKIYVSPKGTIRVMTVSADTNVEIRELQGSTFKIIETIGKNAYPVYHDSVSVHGLCTTWLGKDRIFYCHGQVSENEREGVYKLGTATGTASGIMFLGNIGTSSSNLAFYISDTAAGPTYRLYKWSPHQDTVSGGGTAYKGDVYSLVKMLPAMSTVNYIDVYCRPAGSGAGTIATIKPYFNQSTTAWASKAVTLDEAGTGLKRIEVGKPYVNAIQLEIEFSTSVNLSGNTDFSPSFVIVDYSVTKTKA